MRVARIALTEHFLILRDIMAFLLLSMKLSSTSLGSCKQLKTAGKETVDSYQDQGKNNSQQSEHDKNNENCVHGAVSRLWRAADFIGI